MANSPIQAAINIAMKSRTGFDDGGPVSPSFLDKMFSGDSYQSTGEKTVDNGKVNWGDPDSSSDFFKADKAYQNILHPQASPSPEPVAYPNRISPQSVVSNQSDNDHPVPPQNIPNVDTKDVDRRLTDIVSNAHLPDGYSFTFTSGFRPNDTGSQHQLGKALDVAIVGPDGKIVPNYQSPENFRLYEQFAQSARQYQLKNYPELTDNLRWGGYFGGPKGKYGAVDMMHFDLGGSQDRGMLGGSWANGLTDDQRKLMQNKAVSYGMNQAGKGRGVMDYLNRARGGYADAGMVNEAPDPSTDNPALATIKNASKPTQSKDMTTVGAPPPAALGPQATQTVSFPNIAFSPQNVTIPNTAGGTGGQSFNPAAGGVYRSGGAVEKAMHLARGGYQDGGPPTDQDQPSDNTSTQASILPLSKDTEGNIHFDPHAGILGSVIDAFTLPHDVMSGNVDPMSDEGIKRATNFALTTMGGGAGGAEAKEGETVLGSGPIRKALDTVKEMPERQLNDVGLYSNGAEVANQLPQAKGKADDLINMLRNKGVKPAELENAGLTDSEGNIDPYWSGKTITKDELANHLQDSVPQVSEQVYGAKTKLDRDPYTEKVNQINQKYREDHLNLLNSPVNSDEELRAQWKAMDDLRAKANQDIIDLRSTPDYQKYLNAQRILPAKYGEYTLPGGNTYRELLLKLEHNNQYDAEYEGPHWTKDPNTLAHVRLTDRTGPDGKKYLHVEEIQSDWGQEGREKGFGYTPTQKEIDEMNANYTKTLEEFAKKRDAFNDAYNQAVIDKYQPNDALKAKAENNIRLQNQTELYNNRKNKILANNDPIVTEDQRDKFLNLLDEAQEAYSNHLDAKSKFNFEEKPPIAPYVTSTQGWTDLALKRIMKEAAKGNYDGVLFTPGEAQADRYSLRNYADKLAYDPEDKTLSWYRKSLGWYDLPGNIEPHEISKYIGKDASEKLLSSEPNALNGRHFLETDKLPVGGSGMINYYDKMVPNQLQKLASKYDKSAKVQMNNFKLSGDRYQPYYGHTLMMTPQMRQQILKGQPAFNRGGEVYKKGGAVESAFRISRRGFAEDGFVNNDLNNFPSNFEDKDPSQFLNFGDVDNRTTPSKAPILPVLAGPMALRTAKGIADAVSLPHDVMTGEVDPNSDEGISRALDFANTIGTGGLGGAEANLGETVLGSGPVRKTKPLTEAQLKSMGDIFDFSRLHEQPKVEQFDLPRYEPPRGVPERVTDVTSDPAVRDKMLDIMQRGKEMGGPLWYNADPLRDEFVARLGTDTGPKAFRNYMDMVAATSPRSGVGENARNASYYYQRAMTGQDMPSVGDKNPQPYGHMAQRLHQLNAQRVMSEGWDPLQNPKPASFVENLTGNQAPVTVDTHAFRLPAMLAQDPRYLETAYQASKDAPKQNIQKMVESGEMPMSEAVGRGSYWQALPKANEYKAMEQYYKSLSPELGLTPAQGQAAAWISGGKLTGLASDESKPFLRFFQDRIYQTAHDTGMDPKDVLDAFIRGKITLKSEGGAVNNAMRIVKGQKG